MKQVVLFVEGPGDVDAAPVLVERLIKEHKGYDALLVDPKPFKVGGLATLVRENYANWIKYLRLACKTRKAISGVLLLLDGDAKRVGGKIFCAKRVAIDLAREARRAGAGVHFSVAVVFACMEYESWLLAGIESLAGKTLTDGREGVRVNARVTDTDLEAAPRDAKRALGRLMAGGYKQTLDQKELTKLVEFAPIRARPMRSFRRLESAVGELITSAREDSHVSTPVAG